MTDWYNNTRKEMEETGRRVRAAIAEGLSPTDAINMHAHTAESYAACLKEHNLKPVITD